MLIAQFDVALTMFLYLSRNQSKCSTLNFSKARKCCTDMIICLTLDILLLTLL